MNLVLPFSVDAEKNQKLFGKEVLMIRNKVKIPPIKDGHRYRIVVGGAAHVNFGEGFAIYVDGKLIGESKTGVAVRQEDSHVEFTFIQISKILKMVRSL